MHLSHTHKMSSNYATVVVAIAVLAAAAAMSTTSIVSGQITTACTNSLISSFTPCMNVITGSTNGGGSPTKGCCNALGDLIGSGSECACLIFTGNVPVSLPINRTLAITLPRLCKSKSVPLQCKATGTPLPGPGSTALAPSLPPLPPFSGTGSTGSDSVSPSSTPSATEPASPPVTAAGPTNQGMNQGRRPVVVPNSAAATAKLSILSSSSVLVLVVLGTLRFNN